MYTWFPLAREATNNLSVRGIFRSIFPEDNSYTQIICSFPCQWWLRYESMPLIANDVYAYIHREESDLF